MSSLMSRMMGLLGLSRGRKKKLSPAERRSSFRRQLRIEGMEERRLLAFGAVGGTVFSDVTDDGLTGDDTNLAAVTVTLVRDVNNDGLIDAGDTTVGTQSTGAGGTYLFEDLTDGQYIVQQTAVAGLLQRTNVTTQVVTVSNDTGIAGTPIDRFETVTAPDPLVAAAGATENDQQTAGAGVPSEIIGGERDVSVVNDVGSGSTLSFNVDPAGTVLIDAGVTTTGDVFITYDGADGSATTNAHGLGGIDLTDSQGRAFRFNVGSQGGSLLTVEIYSGNDVTASSRTLAIPATVGGGATATLDFDFADFTQMAGATGAADFTNVSAIRIHANMAAADDISIDLIGIVGLSTTTADFANLAPMTIGDLVFQDTNNNGTFDTGETGLGGVTVELYQDDGSGGLDAADTLVATTTTGAAGDYSFGGTSSLLPGDYIVLIPDANFAASAVLEDFVTSTGNDPAPDPDDDANDDDNGAVVAGFGIASQVITLASTTEPTNDGDADNNTNLALDFGFVPEIDLSVTKVVQGGATSVIAGDRLTYTVTLTNNGAIDATNVVLTDNLPDFTPTALNIISTTSTLGGTVNTAGPSSGEITVTYATLAAGASDTITIEVEYPADAAAAAVVTNTASATGDQQESDAANNSASVDVALTRAATLTVTKTDSPDPVVVGDNLTHTIVVTNTGPSTATNVLFTDTLPAGLTMNGTPTTTIGTVTPSANSFSVNIPTLTVGASATIIVQSTVDQNFAGTTVTNTVNATADEATTVQADEPTTVNPSIDLAITKVDTTDPIDRGNNQVYTLVVTNNGFSQANGVVINDTLPANVTFVSATGGTVSGPAVGSQDFSVALGALAAGASSTVTVTVTVDNDAPDSITNTAIVTSNENAFETNTANNTATADTTINPAVDLAITKVDSADPAIAGDALTYTMTVTNNGPSTANNVQFTDALPAGVTFVSATPSQGTVANNAGTVSGNLGTLASGASAAVTVVVNIDPATTGSLSNTASVTADEPELNTADNSATEPTTINQSVDLVLTKLDNMTSVNTGGTVTYELVVTNNGPSTATNVVLTDVLPTELSFVSGTSTAGTVTNTNGTVTVDIGTLTPGQSQTVTLNTTVVGTTPGTITNTASVTAAEGEADTTNNSASDNVQLQNLPLSKRALLASA